MLLPKSVCRLLGCAMILLPQGAAAANPPATDAAGEFFEQRIRPVLVEHCYACHNSHDTREGELALDHRDGLLSGGSQGPALVPGDPEQSRLLLAMQHRGDVSPMPEGNPRLDEAILRDFAKWIEQGAFDPRDSAPSAAELTEATSWPALLQRRRQWWSLQPITAPEPPVPPQAPQPSVAVAGDRSSGQHRAASEHPVDRFIRSRLAEAGLSPAPPAAPEVLVRRLFVQLTGLPATMEEATAWTTKLARANGHQRAAVVEELVDQLLSRPAYAEKWARHWMDWIRYAESHGSEGDPVIPDAWRYRDYLIRAWQQDVPFDQLLREHIAGDLLENPRIDHATGTNESVLGAAHWRMVFHGFAPTDALDEKVRFIDDQINTFSKAFLGMTVSCARCHDHKFDAISQADYYALFGIFASCRPGRAIVDVPDPWLAGSAACERTKPPIREQLSSGWLEDRDAVAERIAEDVRAGEWKSDVADLRSLRRLVEASRQAQPAETLTAAWKQGGSRATATDREETTIDLHPARQSWYASGPGFDAAPDATGGFAVAPEGDRVLNGIYPQAVSSHLRTDRQPARLTSIDVPVEPNRVLWVLARGSGATLRYVVHDYPRSGTVYPVQTLSDQWKWYRFDLDYWAGDRIHVELATAADAPLLVSDRPRSWFSVRDVRMTSADAQAPPLDAWLFDLPAADAQAPPTDAAALAGWLHQKTLSAVTAWQAGQATDAQAILLDVAIRRGWLPNGFAQRPGLEASVKAFRNAEQNLPALRRVPSLEEATGRDHPLFVRGNHKQPGPTVPRRFLEVLGGEPYRSSESGRRELAEDLLRRSNPLTDRVMVNRIWHHLFGQGIVSTPDNFGKLGDTPSHPELLDYLATRFRREGYSFRSLIRFLVTSQTWQQSSRPAEAVAEIDPDNRLLSHARVRRMEAEAVRDAMLALAGRLDRTVGGPPVAATAPRRSIYVRVRRNNLDPLLRVFDFPEPATTVGRRTATNVPAQSLAMLNDPGVQAAAQAWGRRVAAQAEAGNPRAPVQRMIWAALGRPATEEQLDRMVGHLDRLRDRWRSASEERRALGAQIEAASSARQDLLDRARQRWLATRDSAAPEAQTEVPTPVAAWDFAQGSQAVIGSVDLDLRGGAHVDDGALVVRGGGYAVSGPLPTDVTAKTLEAWVQLDRLDQRAGGVVSIQRLDGSVFDAIVYGEKQPGHWLSGSNVFQRTEGFSGQPERQAAEQPVHLVIVYDDEGGITAYRDGAPYGKAYSTDGPVAFAAGQTRLTLGLRHLPAVGNRLLDGRIFQARLYDTGLAPEQVAARFKGSFDRASESTLRASLEPAEQRRLDEETEKLRRLRAEFEALAPVPEAKPAELYGELARTIFLLQEFIYVR